jgi:hypothetical protein
LGPPQPFPRWWDGGETVPAWQKVGAAGFDSIAESGASFPQDGPFLPNSQLGERVRPKVKHPWAELGGNRGATLSPPPPRMNAHPAAPPVYPCGSQTKSFLLSKLSKVPPMPSGGQSPCHSPASCVSQRCACLKGGTPAAGVLFFSPHPKICLKNACPYIKSTLGADPCATPAPHLGPTPLATMTLGCPTVSTVSSVSSALYPPCFPVPDWKLLESRKAGSSWCP